MDEIPDPVLLSAMSYLNTKDAMRLTSVSHRFMTISISLWRHRPVLVKIDTADQTRVSIIDPFLHRLYYLPAISKAMLSVRSVAVFNQHLIIICVNADRSNIIYQFQSKSQSWRRLNTIPSTIVHVIACLPLNQDELCVVGSESVMIYSRKAKSWRDLTRVPRPHFFGAAALIDDTILVCGGCCSADSEGEPSPPHAQIDIYDIRSKKWRQGKDIPRPCESMASVVWDKGLVLAGGYTDVDLESISGDVHIYNNNDDFWTSIGAIIPSPTFCLFTLERSLVAFTGGNRFLRYDKDTDDWENFQDQLVPQSYKMESSNKSLILTIDLSIIGDIKFESVASSEGQRSHSLWSRRLRRRS